ncbi:MAG: hypothetical protein ABI983_09810, partial [Acidobacteriota bacterium]
MRRMVASLAVVATSVAVLSAQEQPGLDVVLARTARYVADSPQQLQGIVAEEAYSQNVLRN